ncbi:glutaredoxin [Leptospira ognonensis]|uniref:Glutaredoxin n=1 Tax=Leptospira ognonensis TaxID=2484945 RepID=A0A4R9JXM7_9LEPT|nr:glutathione S-transferase N-terminal domain-containing protein [Leptospira ognonensis]TGL57287.1 glutaredoxin [Leptospira ognonensis]
MIKIYHYFGCPYCYRVLSALEALGLKVGKDYKLVEALRGSPGREEVVRLGGQSQVPFMVDGDVKMYESADIIHYLENKFS